MEYIADTFYQEIKEITIDIRNDFPEMEKVKFRPTPAFAEAVESQVQAIGYSPYPDSTNAREWASAFNAEADAIGYDYMNESWLAAWFANALLKEGTNLILSNTAAYQKGYERGIDDGRYLEPNIGVNPNVQDPELPSTALTQTGCANEEYVAASDMALIRVTLDEIINKILKNEEIKIA